MTLPARNRPPPPMPGSPEALQAEEERNRILASKGQTTALAASQPPSQPLAVPSGTLAPLPPLPPSKRLDKIPVAKYDMTTFTGSSGIQRQVVDMEKVPTATGNKPAAFVEHTWTRGGGAKGQPDWLDQVDGGRVCAVCGVQESTGSVVMPGMAKGMAYVYRDATNKEIVSGIPLGCPTFVGHVNGSIGEAKQRIRGLDVQMETVHDRLDRLEADNLYLREQLEAKIQLDVTGLVAWLGTMAKLAAEAQLPMSPVVVNGLGLEVPTPIADLVKGVGEASKVTVDVHFEDDEDPNKGTA